MNTPQIILWSLGIGLISASLVYLRTKNWKSITATGIILSLICITILSLHKDWKTEKIQQAIALLETDEAIMGTSRTTGVQIQFEETIEVLGKTITRQASGVVSNEMLQEIAAVRPDLVTTKDLTSPKQNPILATWAGTNIISQVGAVVGFIIACGILISAILIFNTSKSLQDGAATTLAVMALFIIAAIVNPLINDYRFWKIATREGATISLQGQMVYVEKETLFTIQRNHNKDLHGPTIFIGTTNRKGLHLKIVQKAEKRDSQLASLMRDNPRIATILP